MRLNPAGLADLARLLAEHLAVVRGKVRKVAVVDLDDTLWGGVLGEVGLRGLELGTEGIGLAFQDFQRELLKWHDAGILLAVCSKNDEEEALAALDQHAEGILRSEHFAARRINWLDKAQNLRAIADELNLSLDSFVFLDDNPTERAWVSSALPEVLVPDLPQDPVDRPSFLRTAPYVQCLHVTDTDRNRARSYQSAQSRNQWKARAGSFDEFLASLQLELEVAPLRPGSLARAAQMCQRTNQFNLTTKRYSPADLERFMTDETATVFTLATRDRFEDSGITGLAILRYQHEQAEIDTFLLSCRVLGRRIEDAFLAFLVRQARAHGVVTLIGRYIPTGKNGQVATFYADRGFRPGDPSCFALRLQEPDALLPFPPQIRLDYKEKVAT